MEQPHLTPQLEWRDPCDDLRKAFEWVQQHASKQAKYNLYHHSKVHAFLMILLILQDTGNLLEKVCSAC